MVRHEQTPTLRGLLEALAAREGPLQATALDVLVRAYQHWNEQDAARTVAAQLAKDYADSWHAFYAQLRLAAMDRQAGRYAAAERLLSEIEPRNDVEANALSAARYRLHENDGDTLGADPRREPDDHEETSAAAAPSRVTAEVYPNPFNPQTTIRYALPESGRVRPTVYDVLGREVAVLAVGVQEAGAHEAVFDAAQHATGVYVYCLEADDEVQTGTLMLVKRRPPARKDDRPSAGAARTCLA